MQSELYSVPHICQNSIEEKEAENDTTINKKYHNSIGNKGLETKEDTKQPKPDINLVARKFLSKYYKVFSANRADLAIFYRRTSCLTYEGKGYQGVQKIMNKLRSLPIKSIKFDCKTVDVQVK